MPKFTVNISQKTVDALTAIIQRENENAGTNLTVLQWLTLQPKLAVIAPQLATAITTLQEQHQADAQASLAGAVRTTRDELLTKL